MRRIWLTETGEIYELSPPRFFAGFHRTPHFIATGTALAIAGATAAAGGIAGGALAAKGAKEQAKAAERAQAEAVAEQRRQFDITQQNLRPWIQAGTGAIQTLQFLLGLGVPPQQAVQLAQQAGQGPQGARGVGGFAPGEDRLSRLREFDDAFEDRAPWMTTGREDLFEPTALSTTGGPAGSNIPGNYSAGDFGSLQRDFSAEDFEADPGYAFRLQEGMKALERSAAARGTVLSGGTLKELARYNQGFASNEFTNAYNRFQSNRATRFNQLAAIAGLGQTTATTLANTGAQNASTIGNLIVGGQTAAAAARASGYNAWGNAIGNAANVPLNWLQLSQLNRTPGYGN